jgi:hypothetical protein
MRADHRSAALRAWLVLGAVCAVAACDGSKTGSLNISISGMDAAPRGAAPAPPQLELRVDGRPGREAGVEAAGLCGQAIEAVAEAVDQFGRSYPRGASGAFQVPSGTTDFSLDTSRSKHVSRHNVSYTFMSDCYPTVTVGAPVLGNLSTAGFALEERCAFTVDIVDRDCPLLRFGRARGSFEIVP